ncbi:12288_t:CDS:2, partial [Racocetra fulgida]
MPFSELVIRNIKELFESYKNYKNFKGNKLTEKAKQSVQACLEIHEYLYEDFKKALAEWNEQSEHCMERKEELIQKHGKEAAIAVGVAFIPGVNVVAAPVIGYRAYKKKKAAKKANNQADSAVTAAENLKKELIGPIETFIVAMREISRSLDTKFSLNQNSEKINIVNSCSFAEENFRNCKCQTKSFDDNDKYVKLLANIQNFNENGWTLLHIAAAAGCKEVVKILLKQKHTYAIDINKMDKNGKTALDLATDNKHTEIAEDLLMEVNNKENDINKMDKNGKTASADNRHTEIAEEDLLTEVNNEEKDIPTEINNEEKDILTEVNNEEKDSNKEEFYHINLAIEKRDINLCKLLLEEKMKKEACFLSSLLHNANAIPKRLSRRVEKKEKKSAILHYCAWKGNIKILKFLLDNEETLGHDDNGKTPLHWAASEGHETTVKYLIELNASLVNEVDKNNETALYDAVWNGHINVIEILLKEKADINIENKNNWKPLDIAIISCQPEAFIFLRKHIANNSKNTDLFNQINGSQLDSYYRFKNNSTMKLVEKLQNVESHLNKPGNNDIDSLSFYQFFLKHIEIYGGHLNYEERKNPEQYKKVLSYLRACTFSKICYLKHELGSNLIIDINEYFETIEDDIKKFNDTKKQNAIKYFNDQYNDLIIKNVQEAYSTIHDIIEPEMENIGNKINEKMKSLIDEAKQLIEGGDEAKQLIEGGDEAKQLIEGGDEVKQLLEGDEVKQLIESAEENKEGLEKEQKNLKNKLILKRLLKILKVTIRVMRYTVGPLGMVDVKSSLNQMGNLCKDEHIKIAKQQLQKLDEVCSNNPMLSDILGEVKKVAGSTDVVENIKDKLEQKQKELEEGLKKQINNVITNKETKEMLVTVQNLSSEFKLADMEFELYDKYQNDKEKFGKLNNAFKQAEDDIKKLESYEESIYREIIPMIEKIQSDICNLGNQIDQKSHVFLDLSKWQVRSSLNEIKIILRQISKGFPEIRDYLTSYIDKLDENMTTIINIYDRIQSYYDQSRLANYIANISSPTNTTEIENEKLKKEIEKLEREIR